MFHVLWLSSSFLPSMKAGWAALRTKGGLLLWLLELKNFVAEVLPFSKIHENDCSRLTTRKTLSKDCHRKPQTKQNNNYKVAVFVAFFLLTSKIGGRLPFQRIVFEWVAQPPTRHGHQRCPVDVLGRQQRSKGVFFFCGIFSPFQVFGY